MTGLKAYWEALRGLRADQRMFLPAIEWLVDETDDPRVRRSGRTTVLATAFIRAACSAPRRQVRVFDHGGGNERARLMIDAIGAMIEKANVQRWFRLRVGPPPSVEAVEGWSFAYEDPLRQKMTALKNARTGSKARATEDCGLEYVLEDVRNSAVAALELGASPDQVLRTVQDAIVRDVMEG